MSPKNLMKCGNNNIVMLFLVAALFITAIMLMDPGLFHMPNKDKKEKYRLRPEVIKVKVSSAPESPDGIFKLPNKMACVPGPGKKAAYYSKDLTPGGICGDQEWVNKAMNGYEIIGGIGGSLLR